MPPATSIIDEKPETTPVGVKAVLLGPPGSGKGTQVSYA